MYSRRDCARSWSGMRTGQYVCAWMLEGHQGLPYTRNAQPRPGPGSAVCQFPGYFSTRFDAGTKNLRTSRKGHPRVRVGASSFSRARKA